MGVPLLTELESLAVEMRRRGWIARAAVVSESGDVLSLCPASFGPASERGSDRGNPTQDTVAHLAVATVDASDWLYADLGAVRWMARIEPTHEAAAAAAWLTQELQKLGVTVELDAAAHD